jgi:outer membrane receptor protein involved in Fe transport
VTRAGELRLEGFVSYLLMRKFTDIAGRDINLRGTFDLTQNILGTAYPLMMAHSHLAWTWRSWAVSWSTDFIGGYAENLDRNGFLAGGGGPVRTVGSTLYHDVTLEHAWRGFASMYLAVDNVLDRRPPRVNNGLEDNTDSPTYRLEGRMYSLGMELTF